MNPRKTVLGLVLLLLVAATVMSACGGTATEPPATAAAALDGETLLQERCTECHGLERTTSAQKSRAEWEETVTRMVNRGAELNDEEQAVLVDYLAETYGP